MSVQVSDSLQLGMVDTPLDARTRISTLGDVSNIALPFVGMMFFCTSTGKYYRVVSLKAKQIGAAQQANAQIDQFEVIPDKTDLDGKADADHTHAFSELTGTPGSFSGLSLGIIKSYDPETGTVSVQDANDDWTENTSGNLHENVVVP